MKIHKTDKPLVFYIEENRVFTKIVLSEDTAEARRLAVKKYINKQARMRYITQCEENINKDYLTNTFKDGNLQ